MHTTLFFHENSMEDFRKVGGKGREGGEGKEGDVKGFAGPK